MQGVDKSLLYDPLLLQDHNNGGSQGMCIIIRRRPVSRVEETTTNWKSVRLLAEEAAAILQLNRYALWGSILSSTNSVLLGFGPFQLKNMLGKTPVLDGATFSKIKSGHIKVFCGVKRIRGQAVEFFDGKVENFDAIVLATGYKSNVSSWLKENDMFCEEDGFLRKPFPNGWKGENGLYAAGFTKRGLLKASMEARRIAEDIHCLWELDETMHYMTFSNKRQHQS